MSTYESDIEFVISECARFSKMEFSEIRKLPLNDALSGMPHPSGEGSMLCGEKAELRLIDLAGTAISRSEFSGRLDLNCVTKNLKKNIVRRFLVESREINRREADRAVSAAIRLAAQSMIDLTHFIPCHLVAGDAPEAFSIGPVTFKKHRIAFNSIEPALQSYLEQNAKSADDPRQLTEDLVSDAREYYGSFDWIAEVRIEKCDPSVSRKRAERIIQSALNCFHLLIGASHSSTMRVGGPNYKVDRRSKIEIDPDGVAEVSRSASWRGEHLGDNWWETINSNGADELIELMGIAIEFGHDPSSPSPLGQRFVDAASWYGEAVRDSFSASRLVKYVTAIERIVTTKNEIQLSQTIASRGAAIMVAAGVGDFSKDKKRIEEIYDMRCQIVHGSRSPIEPGMGPALWEAEKLARLIVLSSLHSFRAEGLKGKDLSTNRLDRNYDELVEFVREKEGSGI